MKNKIIFLCELCSFLLLFIISGCSSAKYPYDRHIDMEVDKKIRDSYQLLPEIPLGWFVAEDESVPNNIVVLLLENKYRAAIILSEIKISKNAREVLSSRGLEELANMSFEMKRESTKDSLNLCSENIKYKIDDKEFITYHYKQYGSNDTACVLIFKAPETYYELSSLFLKNKEQSPYITRDSLLSIQYGVFRKIIKK